MRPDLCFWALTREGAGLARTLAAEMGGRLFLPERLIRPAGRDWPPETGFVRLAPALASHWHGARGHVFVAAAGIVIRAMAPLLQDKTTDPAVVVCDQGGRFAVSLLSGHVGGANELARRVAEVLGGQAVITTATDCAGLPAFDVLAAEAGCACADSREVKPISAALLDGKPIRVVDPLAVLDRSLFDHPLILADDATDGDDPAGGTVRVSISPKEPRPGLLRLHPRWVCAGVGCRRGVGQRALKRAVEDALAQAGLASPCLARLASAELKQDEAGLTAVGRALGVPVLYFSAEALAAVPVLHSSARAASVLGVEAVGVCEAAALLAAGEQGRLLLGKRVYDRTGTPVAPGSGAGWITLALAGSWPLAERIGAAAQSILGQP